LHGQIPRESRTVSHRDGEVAVSASVIKADISAGAERTFIAKITIERQRDISSITGRRTTRSATNTVARRQTNCSGSVWKSNRVCTSGITGQGEIITAWRARSTTDVQDTERQSSRA